MDPIITAPDSSQGPRWTGEAAVSQQDRFNSPDRSGGLKRLKALDRMTAQDLKERTFGEKSQMDFAKLSLAQQKQLIDQSLAVEKITAGTHSRELEARRALSAAAAIEKLGELDHSDPKFEQKLTKILADHPDALNSQSLMQVVSGQRAQAEAYTKALHERTAASFGDPMAKAAYEKTLAETKDPHLANIAAEATAERVEKAKSLYGSADLTPEDRAKIYDPSKGAFNFDNLNAIELKVAQGKAARESAAKDASTTGTLDRAFKSFAEHYGDKPKQGEEQWITDARYNLQQGLKNSSFNAMTGTVPATGATAPATVPPDPFQQLTGKPLPVSSTPAPAAVPATPAVTPAPTPAATPAITTAAAPSGDIADRWASTATPAPVNDSLLADTEEEDEEKT